jgi:D-glycero-beta-D-manno-heptose 1-phosphate adenylyltransferase
MFKTIESKILDATTAQLQVEKWQSEGLEIVFTNGCFDLLHYGHVRYLAEARALGDKLVVGLNSTDSVRRLKGQHRPINDELTRQTVLAALQSVDVVVVFQSDTPYDLIYLLKPDILVKGGDWQPTQIVGSDWVLENGGQVLSLPFRDGYSTTNLETKIKATSK